MRIFSKEEYYIARDKMESDNKQIGLIETDICVQNSPEPWTLNFYLYVIDKKSKEGKTYSGIHPIILHDLLQQYDIYKINKNEAARVRRCIHSSDVETKFMEKILYDLSSGKWSNDRAKYNRFSKYEEGSYKDLHDKYCMLIPTIADSFSEIGDCSDKVYANTRVMQIMGNYYVDIPFYRVINNDKGNKIVEEYLTFCIYDIEDDGKVYKSEKYTAITDKKIILFEDKEELIRYLEENNDCMSLFF